MGSHGSERDFPPCSSDPCPSFELSGDQEAGAVQAFLEEIKATGYQFPRAPFEATYNPRLVDQRRGHFTDPPSIEMQYTCYRCLEVPDVAYVAETRDGWVWLDLCYDCSLWMLRGIRKLRL